MSNIVRVCATVLGVLAVAGAAVFFYTNTEALDTTTTTSTSLTNLPSSYFEPRLSPPGFKEYRSYKHDFSLFYPEGLVVKEYNEGGGASTITFANNERGFQLFIVPHTDSQISPERFMADVPSGVREGEVTTKVDGVEAVKFWSEDAALGATREVWFIHRGFLFEVTTLRPLDLWLEQILSTWKFI